MQPTLVRKRTNYSYLVNSDFVAMDVVIYCLVKFIVEQFKIVATSTTGIFQLMPIVVL